MAQINGRIETKLYFHVELEESEARALKALAGYGDEAFVKTFYEKLGKAYLEPHIQGLKRLFAVVRTSVVPMLARVDDARGQQKELDE